MSDRSVHFDYERRGSGIHGTDTTELVHACTCKKNNETHAPDFKKVPATLLLLLEILCIIFMYFAPHFFAEYSGFRFIGPHPFEGVWAQLSGGPDQAKYGYY